jgi:dimethylglycine dehydrogenase
MVGVDLPVTPMEHHYLVTEGLEGLRALDREVPVIVDLDGFTYARQERDGLLLGVYERNPKHWMMDGAPWDYGIELIPEDIDRIGDELAIGFDRYPELADVGIRKWVNGAFTFAPDGNPLVGPVGPRGYWVACGVMAGFSQGGGVGKSLAEWMIHGAPESDIFGMDVARFGPHQSNKEYIRQTTAQFYARRMLLTYPNEQLPAGRNIRQSGAYQDMDAAGARWGNVWGLELPIYFADRDFEEPGTLRRSPNFPLVAAECEAVRDAAGLLDISGFARYRVSGAGAEAWLDRLLACKLPAPGRVKLAPMLAEDGRLKGDMTLFNWGDGTYWLMGSYYLRSFHMRWFEQHLQENVQIEDISDAVNGFLVTGPRTFDILNEVSDTDLGGLHMMRCGIADLGLHRCQVARLSLSGEVGVEISCTANEHASLRRLMLAAGEKHGLREIGFWSMLSMRLEKSIGIWNAEYTQCYTPAETGLDRWIDWDKGDFIGRDAARAAETPAKLLVMLEVDASDADAVGFEPVWQDGSRIGITTSGGYGHRTGKSLALAMVDPAAAAIGTALSLHVLGEERAARVIEMSPYDPTGARARC